MVKKSQTPAGTVRAPWGCGQGAWVVLTLRCGCARWVQLLGAGLIWKFAWIDFLTIRVESRATARSLNVCPYRDTDFPHRHPRGSRFYEGDNYFDAGGGSNPRTRAGFPFL